MQAVISTKDYFTSRCRAAREGRRIAKTEDLLRLAPFLNGQMADDIRAFCKLVARRLKGDCSTTTVALRTLLEEIGDTPVPSRRAWDVLNFLHVHEDFAERQSVLAKLIESRFRIYSATDGVRHDVEHVILMCLDRIADNDVRHGYQDYLIAAVGWAVHRRQMFYERTGIHTPRWIQRDGLGILAGLLELDFGV